MHTWLVYIHVLGGFIFMLAHGASAAVVFRIRHETSVDSIRSLLNISANTFPLMYVSLLVLLAAGIAAGFSGKYWDQIWIWLAIGLLLLMVVAMSLTANRPFTAARKSAGLPFFEGMKQQEPVEPLSDDEIFEIAKRISPWPTLIIGIGGLLIILWLMIFKPF